MFRENTYISFCVTLLGLVIFFIFVPLGRIRAQPEMTVESPGTPPSEIAVTEDSSTTNVPQKAGFCSEDDEGKTRNRSGFPKHPELFRPMPIPDPTKKPPKPSKDDPEVPESHTIGNGNEP